MRNQKIVIVIGSPRKEGNSATLAQQVTAGAQAHGADVECFHLHDMNIHPCDACDLCRESTEAECVIEDAMQDLYPRLRGADALVIASPIYWFTVSAQTKLFMDRCYALGGPEGNALAGKRIGIVLVYADPDPFISGAVNALRTFQDGFRYIGAEIVGMVYGSAWEAGAIRNHPAVMDNAYHLGVQLAAAPA